MLTLVDRKCQGADDGQSLCDRSRLFLCRVAKLLVVVHVAVAGSVDGLRVAASAGPNPLSLGSTRRNSHHRHEHRACETPKDATQVNIAAGLVCGITAALPGSMREGKWSRHRVDLHGIACEPVQSRGKALRALTAKILTRQTKSAAAPV